MILNMWNDSLLRQFVKRKNLLLLARGFSKSWMFMHMLVLSVVAVVFTRIFYIKSIKLQY